MKINADTKISELLKADDDMVDFIMSIHPKFSKLSNPFLRKAIAPRVTVRDAARIAGMPVEELLNKLAEKGFEIETGEPATGEVPVNDCHMASHYRLKRIPAAEMLEQNKDPFDVIRRALLELQPGEAVEVVLDFIPAPLIDIFSKQGFEWCVENKDGMYHTYFYRPSRKKSWWQKIKEIFTGKGTKETSVETFTAGNDADFEELLEKYKDKMEKIDVRDLEMPQPMMTILEKLKTLPEGKALYVDHKRIPQFLLPELEKTGYRWAAKRINPDYTQMIIYKPALHD